MKKMSRPLHAVCLVECAGYESRIESVAEKYGFQIFSATCPVQCRSLCVKPRARWILRVDAPRRTGRSHVVANISLLLVLTIVL